MKNLVTVTCNRDFHNMILQAESIQKFVEPCTHWIVINEFDNLDIDKCDDNITSFAFHPLIFNSLSTQHTGYINYWLSKMNFSFQFTLR